MSINDTPNYVYPLLTDPDFNQKIANKKEFQDNKLNGVVAPIKERAEVLERMPFELSSHQLFVKSFMSFQTPYNSMLLYHGLGTGKTCSAIGIAEDMRVYLKKFQINKSIIIVASPNVQTNFRLQLFDESKLFKKNGEWNFNGCVGNSIIKEINPTGIKNYPREKVIQQINIVIKKNYTFLGYIQFSNVIESLSTNIDKLKDEFNGRLVIIDEYHNMRTAFDAEDKRTQKKQTTKQLDTLVDNADNLRLLLLSATPTYNSYKEIIWTLNLLNKNDKRPPIKERDIFEKNGNFKPDGRERLINASRGYVSFVKGDNPYVFPFRVYPFNYPYNREKHRHRVKHKKNTDHFPTIQLNGVDITEDSQLKILRSHLTFVKINKAQSDIYEILLENTIKMNENFRDLSGFKYTELQLPIQCLNIAYPTSDVDADADADADADEETTTNPATYVGSEGLKRIMRYRDTMAFKDGFEYRNGYEGFFNLSTIGQYSCKIQAICNEIINSTGVILIYSNYLDGGLVPMALALEEMGMRRYGEGKSLFETPPSRFNGQQYVMITGDKRLSPNNPGEVTAATNILNRNGEAVKVILITSAGAEGIDLKFIRQVHILDPWYNMNRIEQIIGRAVRNFSHKDLPFDQRNVQIFLYATLLRKEEENVEAIDLYVYRKAEQKAIQMGRITRVLKEGAVDCLLNYEQQNYTHKNLVEDGYGYVRQVLADGTIVPDFPVGDMPYSANCDYMETCEYVCSPYSNKDEYEENLNQEEETYDETFIKMNTNALQKKIESLFRESYIYNYEKLYKELTKGRTYNNTQVYYALSNIIDKRIMIYDKYERPGYLVNVGEFYLFQPKELSNIHIDLYERRNPLMYKRNKLHINLNEKYLKKIKEPSQDFTPMDVGVDEKEREPKQGLPIVKKSSTTILIEEIYNRIKFYDKDPGEKQNKEDANDMSRFLGQSVILLRNSLKEMIDADMKTHFIDLAVSCAIDTFSYEQKIELIRDHFQNKFKGHLKKIVKGNVDMLVKNIDGTKVAILYRYDPLEKTLVMDPKIIGENGQIEAGVSYDTEMAINDYLKEYKDQTRKMLHTPLGYVAYEPKKNGCFFKTIELDKKRNTGRFCYQKTRQDLTGQDKKGNKTFLGDIDKMVPEDIVETFVDTPFYNKMKKEQLCSFLMLLLKILNEIRPEKVWYVNFEEYQAIFGKEE
jgi:hypothetical protein